MAVSVEMDTIHRIVRSFREIETNRLTKRSLWECERLVGRNRKSRFVARFLLAEIRSRKHGEPLCDAAYYPPLGGLRSDSFRPGPADSPVGSGMPCIPWGGA